MTKKGLSFFIRSTPLTDIERLQLVEARRELLSSHLNHMTLPELGSVECVQDEFGSHSIARDNPVFENDGDAFTLKTQGIYRVAGISGEGLLLWGLLRSGEWIIATLQMEKCPGYKGSVLRKVKKVAMRVVSLSDMLTECGMVPDVVWFELERVANQVLDHRKSLYDSALSIVSILQAEKKALDLLNSKLWSMSAPD